MASAGDKKTRQTETIRKKPTFKLRKGNPTSAGGIFGTRQKKSRTKK